MSDVTEGTGYLASGKPPARLGDPPPGPPLGYVVPRRIRLAIDRGRPFEQLPDSYDDGNDGLWPTVRADNPFDVLVLPASTTTADRSAIDAHGVLLATHWKAKLQIRRSGPGHVIEQKYGPEIDYYPDRVAWALEQLHLEGGLKHWLRDLDARRLERARAAMQERIELALADRILTSEELDLLLKHAAEAGYEPEEFAEALLPDLEALGLRPSQPVNGTTAQDRLVRGGTWTTAPTPPVQTRPHRVRTTLVFVLGMLPIVILVSLLFALPSEFDKSIEAALNDNRLISPPNRCAFDLWLNEQRMKGHTTSVLAAAQRIGSRLTALGRQSYLRWYTSSDHSVKWKEVAGIYSRLHILFPEEREFDLRRLYAEGQVAFEQQSYDAALQKFSQVLAGSPARAGQLHVLALNGIGRVHEARRNDDVAAIFYESCMNDEPEFAWAFLNRARQYMHHHQWEPAERLLRRAQYAAPRAPTILTDLGIVCEQQQKYRDALSCFEEAYQITPDEKLVPPVARLRRKLGITVN
jgi:tetratricopeptide (TPR) repeat protein